MQSKLIYLSLRDFAQKSLIYSIVHEKPRNIPVVAVEVEDTHHPLHTEQKVHGK